MTDAWRQVGCPPCDLITGVPDMHFSTLSRQAQIGFLQALLLNDFNNVQNESRLLI